jgi:glycosyltransferase involved in cell wall biosynthesis
LSKLVRDKEIDIMHAHTRVTQVAAAISSAFTKVPYVATCHGFFKRRLGRMLFGAWGSKAIAISGPVRESLIRDFGVPPGKISLVRNGIELDRFSRNFSGGELAGFKEAIGLKDWPVIGTIGRLSPVKGQKTLIEAVRNLNAQCVIVGDGPESARLKGLAKDLGVDDRVYFLKSDMDTAKFLAVMDVFVLPSMKEGLGLALMEAMAAGRPCVASDVGGISDIVKDGSSGLVFPAGDAGALKAAISRLIGDEPLRRRLGASAARFARENFSSGAMAEEIVKVYREVLAQYAVK